MRKTLYLLVFTFLLSAVTLGTETSCSSSKTSTDKRIKQQKKRQRKNPGDCPRIDCRVGVVGSKS